MPINQEYKAAIKTLLPLLGKGWKFIAQDQYGGVRLYWGKPVKRGDGWALDGSNQGGSYLPLHIPECDDWTKSKLEVVRDENGNAINIKQR